MKKYKVLQIVPDLSVGGAQKLAIDISTHLANNNYSVIIVTMLKPEDNSYYNFVKERNIRIISLDKKLGFDFKVIIKLIRLIKKERPDIVHTHTNAGVYAILPAILNNVKVRVHTIHNIAEKELSYIHRKIMLIAYKFFKFIPVAISDLVKSTIVDEYKISDKKIALIYNGIDTKIFKSRRGKQESKIVRLIHVGRFSPQKNHVMLINAFSRALKENINLKLTLVGDGELKPLVINKVEELGLTDKVEFKGIISKVQNLLNESDIFVLSSDWEGLPIAVLEAMACGLPVIATKSGGTPDIVKCGENGILVDIGDEKALADAIINLSSDKSIRAEMGSTSFKMSKSYDIKNMTKKYSNLYRNSLKYKK